MEYQIGKLTCRCDIDKARASSQTILTQYGNETKKANRSGAVSMFFKCMIGSSGFGVIASLVLKLLNLKAVDPMIPNALLMALGTMLGISVLAATIAYIVSKCILKKRPDIAIPVVQFVELLESKNTVTHAKVVIDGDKAYLNVLHEDIPNDTVLKLKMGPFEVVEGAEDKYILDIDENKYYIPSHEPELSL